MDDTNIFIQKGEQGHVSDLLNLIKELAIYERAESEVVNTVDTLIEDGFGDNPLFGFYVAYHRDKIIGMALYYTRYSTWKGKCLYLEDIVVTESWRGRGVGKQLFQAVLNHAKENKFSRMNWQVLDWNEPAFKFYDSFNALYDKGWVNAFINLK